MCWLYTCQEFSLKSSKKFDPMDLFSKKLYTYKNKNKTSTMVWTMLVGFMEIVPYEQKKQKKKKKSSIALEAVDGATQSDWYLVVRKSSFRLGAWLCSKISQAVDEKGRCRWEAAWYLYSKEMKSCHSGPPICAVEPGLHNLHVLSCSTELEEHLLPCSSSYGDEYDEEQHLCLRI